MTYSHPASPAARRAAPTIYKVRRRRALLAVLLLAVSVAAVGQLLAETPSVPRTSPLPPEHRVPSGARGSASSVSWPAQGQAALALGSGRIAASPEERPVSIASVAKVMTAYLVLRRYPLRRGQAGFTVTITAAEAQVETEDAAERESVVAVRAGERLTERQLLEALLIPSGNNIAQLLAARMAGDETRFVAEMNADARTLGMTETTYTDPSGFDPGTVSTAADQLRIFERAMRSAAFRQIVSMGSVTLPVTGTLANFNPLIAAGYDGKTGSDSAARGCLAFFTHVMVGAHRLTATGVVLGQGQGHDTSELLAAAGAAAEQLVESAAPHSAARAPGPPRSPEELGAASQPAALKAGQRNRLEDR